MIKILLTDDHSVIREGMKRVIESFLPDCSIDEAYNGTSALEKVHSTEYDLIILDVNMPETDSLEVVRKIIAYAPSMKILMFSMNEEEIFGKRYLFAGAMGYVKKDAPSDEIRNAILTVLGNKKYMSTKLTSRLI